MSCATSESRTKDPGGSDPQTRRVREDEGEDQKRQDRYGRERDRTSGASLNLLSSKSRESRQAERREEDQPVVQRDVEPGKGGGDVGEEWSARP